MASSPKTSDEILEIEFSAWKDKSILLQMEPWGMPFDIPAGKTYLVQLRNYMPELHIRWHEKGIFVYAASFRLYALGEKHRKGQPRTLISDEYW
jgi:hypothetical protein